MISFSQAIILNILFYYFIKIFCSKLALNEYCNLYPLYNNYAQKFTIAGSIENIF